MSMRITCSGCRRKLNVEDRFAGRSVKCPGCGQPLRIPARPAPASAPAGGDPFAFTEPAPPSYEEATDNDPDVAELWRSVRGGIRLVWIGSLLLSGAPLVLLLMFAIGRLVFGTMTLSEGIMMRPDQFDGPSATGGMIATVTSYIGLAVFGTAVIVGPLLRLAGFFLCVLVPRGAGGSWLAMGLLACECALLAGSALNLALSVIPQENESLILLGNIATWANFGTWPAGLILLLLYLRCIGLELTSKPLVARMTNFSIWCLSGVIVAGGTAGLGWLVSRPGGSEAIKSFSGLLACFGGVLFLGILIILLLKYLNLLDLARDEIRKRAGKWRPD